MAEAKRLTLRDLREIVEDGEELGKGARVYDDGGLMHLARFEHKLFADAKGSGASPYKVQILFEDKGVRGRCSCMAARSRPFCKHAAGLLVAWARAPESFAEAAGPPPGSEGPKRRAVKKGKVDEKDLMARGVEQVSTLVRELAVAGVASLEADRAEQVRALGASLRDARLRRLSARTLELSSHLERAASRSDVFDPAAYAELLGDLLLTARKLEKYIGGEPLAREHEEELIGRTWTKKDRTPISGLELLEYGFITRTTSDNFVIRESRFIELATGEHYSEKQIIPAMILKRTQAKPSWAGKLLARAAGSLFPTFAPRRVNLEEPGPAEPLGHAALVRLLEKALPAVSAALAALQERRRDVFAPDVLPVALRADTIYADGARLQVVDSTDAALFLPAEGAAGEALARVLRGARLAALLGDVALDGALPTLYPMAAIVDRGGELALAPLGSLDASAILESKKIRAEALQKERGRAVKWVEVARAAGASNAAIALGEVREEMAEALANGLLTVVPRLTDPLVSRLRELSLAKQADLLASIATRSDPAEKLDDFVKLHQVLAIALARLAGAAHVDRAAIEPVPTHASVHVPRAERQLEPTELAALQGAGKINRYQAAVHYARYYASLPPEALAAAIYPTWADGSAAPYVVAALAKVPVPAIEAARRALAPPEPHPSGWVVRKVAARVARLTAIQVLEAVGGPEAQRTLSAFTKERAADLTVMTHARRVLARMSGHKATEDDRRRSELCHRAFNASRADDRVAALSALADGAFVEAIPTVRASFLGDVSSEVREAAAIALARLGDVDSVETFLGMLRDRARDNEAAKTAARALGMLGDVRGLDELLRAWAEGWHPAIVAEAMQQIGPAALEPIVKLLEENPALAERKAALGVIAVLPAEDVTGLLVARLEARVSAPPEDFCARASLYLTMASQHPAAAKALAKRIVELMPSMLDRSKSTAQEKALAKKCAKYA